MFSLQTVIPFSSFDCSIHGMFIKVCHRFTCVLTTNETNSNLITPQISLGWHCREIQVRLNVYSNCFVIYSTIDAFFWCGFLHFIPKCPILYAQFISYLRLGSISLNVLLMLSSKPLKQTRVPMGLDMQSYSRRYLCSTPDILSTPKHVALPSFCFLLPFAV